MSKEVEMTTDTLSKYSAEISKIENKFKKVVESTLDGFQGDEVMIFVMNLSSVFVRVKRFIEKDIQDITGPERLEIYNSIVANLIEKIVLLSAKLTDEQKEIVKAYFGKNGLVTNLIDVIGEHYQTALEDMDVNKDNVVTRAEFDQHIAENCGCGNEKCQACCVTVCGACCFPILSGGRDTIKIKKKN